MSFTQGLSGLNAASKDLEVIGNNVANVNTVGFKGSQAQFADVFAASLGGAGAAQIGIGTKLATVAQQFTQGSMSTTNNPLDMAINGPGFFVLHGVNGTGYSRNGQFQVDKSGNVVTSTGKNLQGWAAVGGVVANSGPTSNLVIPTAAIPPVVTSNVAIGLNLDSRATVPTVTPFSPTNLNSYNYSTSSTIYDSLGNARMNTLYFQLAAPTQPSGTVTAVTGTTNTIASTAGLKVGELVNGGPTTIASIAADGVTFTTSAAIAAGATTFGPTTATTTANSSTVTVPSVIGLAVGQPVSVAGAGFPAGTTITSINTTANTFTTSSPATTAVAGAVPTFGAISGNAWNVFTTVADPNAAAGTYLYNPGTSMGTLTFNAVTGALTGPTTPSLGQFQLGVPPAALIMPTLTKGLTYDFSTATQYGATSGVTKITVDGYTSGQLVGYSAAANGTITGQYSNGQTQLLGQVALATFANNQGLQPLGDNEWAATTASGSALTSVPGAGLNGVLQTSSVENSNVDLTAELVHMITAQRDYQANSQTIKTADAIMQTLINMR